MLKAVIFDIGNVIVKVNLELWKEAFAQIGFKNTEQLFQDKEVRRAIEASYGVGKIGTLEFFNFLVTKSGCENVSLEKFKEAWNSVIIAIFKESIEAIRDFKAQGLKIFALSDTNEMHMAFIEELYSKSNLSDGGRFIDLFDTGYLSHETGHRKAQDEAWQDILKEQDLCSEECLFIDDLAPNIVRAQKLGFKVFHYQPQNNMAEVKIMVDEILKQSKVL